MTTRIVITSINPPTKAVTAFAELRDSSVIVVGDRKSPSSYQVENLDFIRSGDEREELFEVSRFLPANHYSRKNIGYLWAMREGATVIIDTDDDNVPYDDYGFPPFDLLTDSIPEDNGFINAYNFFANQSIWPRGLPLRQIKRSDADTPLTQRSCDVGIWQGLADGDPDVDAIYRLTDDTPCTFERRDPLVLGRGTWSPFNSQNTAFKRKFFPLLYLPHTVTFRFTDILRGYVAQPILWSAGYELGFTHATVFQDRNPHDYLKDLVSEFPMYEHVDSLPGILMEAVDGGGTILQLLERSYLALVDHNIVASNEMEALKAWINDCQNHMLL